MKQGRFNGFMLIASQETDPVQRGMKWPQDFFPGHVIVSVAQRGIRTPDMIAATELSGMTGKSAATRR
jgi:hypothetical protein